jgi:hypothetical protein
MPRGPANFRYIYSGIALQMGSGRVSLYWRTATPWRRNASFSGELDRPIFATMISGLRSNITKLGLTPLYRAPCDRPSAEYLEVLIRWTVRFVLPGVSIFKRYPNSKFLNEVLKSHAIFELRSRLDALYANIAGHEDEHFGSQFDCDPQSRIWEMMVATILKDAGLAFTGKGVGPDFNVTVPNRRIWVEAVCPTKGAASHPDSVPDFSFDEISVVPENQLRLRICSALEAKRKKFEDYRTSGVVSEQDCCVIAVSSSKMDGRGSMHPSLGMRAAFGYSNPYMVFDAKSSGVVAEGLSYEPNITKTSSKAISSAVLTQPMYSPISAILYSDASVHSLGFDLFAESELILNPNANNPLPQGLLNIDEFRTSISDDGRVVNSVRFKRKSA